MFNIVYKYEMYDGKQKCINHNLSAVDIPFIEMILH